MRIWLGVGSPENLTRRVVSVSFEHGEYVLVFSSI
jgi:hypothetical protein